MVLTTTSMTSNLKLKEIHFPRHASNAGGNGSPPSMPLTSMPALVRRSIPISSSQSKVAASDRQDDTMPGSVPLPKPKNRKPIPPLTPSAQVTHLLLSSTANATTVGKEVERLELGDGSRYEDDTLSEEARAEMIYIEEQNILHHQPPPLPACSPIGPGPGPSPFALPDYLSPSSSSSILASRRTRPLAIPPVPHNTPFRPHHNLFNESSPFISTHPFFNSSNWSERGSTQEWSSAEDDCGQNVGYASGGDGEDDCLCEIHFEGSFPSDGSFASLMQSRLSPPIHALPPTLLLPPVSSGHAAHRAQSSGSRRSAIRSIPSGTQTQTSLNNIPASNPHSSRSHSSSSSRESSNRRVRFFPPADVPGRRTLSPRSMKGGMKIRGC